MQAHLPTTHAHTQKKTCNSQMFHIRKYTNFFIFFKFWQVSHETDEKIKIRLGKKKKGEKTSG